MKPKNILLLIVVVLVAIIIFYSVQGSQDGTAYVEAIRKERQEKDRFMRTSDESPFADAKDKFTGLKYFNPDTKYRIIAKLYPIETRKVVLLNTTDGQQQRYRDYGYAEFELEGVQNRLLILEVMETGSYQGKLFLAFGDETSARETYGAGRYLDIDKTPGSSTITLDFNKAYNPYCAYSEIFSCPLPPPENLLKVAIKAGEKSYH
jgi:uncharacterized protein (DUF1684 family)